MNVRQRTRTVARLQDVYDAVDRLAETLTPRPGQWPIENAVEPEDVAALTDILDALAIKLTMAGGLPATAKESAALEKKVRDLAGEPDDGAPAA